MAAFNFPNSPSTNDLHTENGVTFKWNGTIWLRVGNSYSDISTLNVSGISTFVGNAKFNTLSGSGAIVFSTGSGVLDDSANHSISGSTLNTVDIEAQGNITVADKIIHRSDTNTSIRFPSNDTVSVETAGSEKVRITSTGNVGINTTNPTSDGGTTLEVYNATNPTIRLNDGGQYKSLFQLRGNDLEIRGSNGNVEFYTGNADGASSTERLRIASDGKVGINEASPDSWFHVNSGSETVPARFESTGTQSRIGFKASGTSNSYNVSVGAEAEHFIAYTNNAERLRITSAGKVGISQSSPNSMIEVTNAGECQIRLGYNQSKYVKIGRSSTGNYQFLSQENGSSLEFGTSTGSDGAGAVHMTMNRYGGVGIRTDKTTSYGFSIAGASAAMGAGNLTDSGGLILQPTDAFFGSNRTYPCILWSGNTDALARARAGITAVSANSNDASHIIFMTRHAANGTALTTDDERMRIADDGVVQVGKDNQSSTTYTQSLYIRGRYVNAEGDFAKLLFRNSSDSGACSAGIRGRRDSNSNYATGLTFHTNHGNNNTTDSGQGRKTMHISSEGWVTMPYQSCFMAHSNGASHLDIGSNASNDYVFTTEAFDNHGDYNNSNGRFTAPVAGKYIFGIQIYAGFSVTGVRVLHARFKKNGGDEYQTDLFGGSSNHGGTSYHPTGAGTVMYSLAANDYVTWNIGTYSASGSGSSQIYGAKGTRFWGYLVA